MTRGRSSRAATIAGRARMRAERRAYVADLLAHGERIVVEGRSPSAVTDTRMIFARTLVVPPRQGEWTHDSLRFDEIATWRLGRTHDERPIIELEHPVHMRIEHVPAHHFLWWRWEMQRRRSRTRPLDSDSPATTIRCSGPWCSGSWRPACPNAIRSGSAPPARALNARRLPPGADALPGAAPAVATPLPALSVRDSRPSDRPVILRRKQSGKALRPP